MEGVGGEAGVRHSDRSLRIFFICDFALWGLMTEFHLTEFHRLSDVQAIPAKPQD
ncbi:MAG: hypothetical protein ACJAVO_000971 [Parvibaculaceae bacterium]|jgi:hypothetical protein